MTIIDSILQQRRIQKAKPFIPAGAALLDIGCHRGEMLQLLQPIIKTGTGIDSIDFGDFPQENLHFIYGNFPEAIPTHFRFSHITALAVVEHIPAGFQPAFFETCYQLLLPKGLLICTIPHPRVDKILAVLRALKLIAGMSLNEHHGYDLAQTVPIAAAAGFQLLHHQPFQLGLNHLFVFSKPGS